MALPDWLSPLLDAPAMREADRWAIEDRDIPSLALMENAGRSVADAAAAIAGDGPIRVVCGKGNNGGDGLVAARMLSTDQRPVEVVLLWPVEELSDDAKVNLERYAGGVRRPGPNEVAATIAGSGAVVDAIFGTGFSGAPREPAAAAIEAINDAACPVLACDIASGIDASTGAAEGVAVNADRTVTFHAKKAGQLIAPGAEHTGELEVADIGIPREAPAEPVAGVIGEQVLDLAPRRGARSNKFSSGNVLVVGGSRGLTGAVCLAGQAAIRAGAGYAAVAAPRTLEQILEVKLTEVMTLGLEHRDGSLVPAAADAVIERSESADCVVLGPGLGRAEGAAELARRLAGELERPLLIDADGLNALGTEPELASREERPLIITPHEGELARLLGTESAEVSASRLESARSVAERCRGIVVLKGADTIVTDGERVAINSLPSPGLATAGTGDVLSGTIAALLARGMQPFEAACAGVLAHARAGRTAAERVGAESVIATDVIGSLPVGLTR
ncbi:MAG TPA: NAD(P)H-hydrate dehydratase [Solirubrobacterales bacterium]|nr:NAD(P)H-hydrate dehydratase [Solirubrobacterales bacterium]